MDISGNHNSERRIQSSSHTRTTPNLDRHPHPHHYRCCGSTRFCWWEPDMDDINDTVDFTQETSLHGLRFICQPQRHLTERIFWFVAFIIAMIIAGILISEIWLAYFNSPVVVTFQPVETTIDRIPFPAVTICNMNKVQRSKAMSYIRIASKNDTTSNYVKEALKNIYYMEHVCSATKSFSQKFNYTSFRGEIPQDILGKVKIQDGDDEQADVASFLRKSSQSCNDMLPLCLWQDEVINCTKLFKPIETDFGKCCSFNMMPQTLMSRHLNDNREDPDEIAEWSAWDYENQGLLITDSEKTKTYPRRQYRAGKSSGLSVLLNPDLDEYFCTSSDSQGFRLVKHLPLDVPHVVDFGIAIRPNSEIFMSVRPELTIADNDIRGFKLEKRNCYFRGEFVLAYFNHYTASNCFDECLANLTYAECKCVRYYMPRDNSRDLCGAGKFNCVEGIRKSWLNTGIKAECGFCLPTCTELDYFSETTVTPMQKGINLWIDDRNRSARWAKKNVSIVHIYFSSDSSYAKVRKELYGITDLIANTGGLMGLCLGFSGLSLVEVIYFYTLRAWCRTRRKKTLWSIMAIKLHRLWLRTQARSEKYDSEVQLEKRTGSCPSILSDNYTGNRNSQGQTGFGKFDRASHSRSPDDEVDGDSNQQSYSKANPFIASGSSKKGQGKFTGYETQYSNS